MDLICDDRPSDSPFVERIWHSRSEEGGAFISMAERHWGMVVTTHRGKTILTVRGPETTATPAYCPEDAEFLGIHFRAGAFMPHLPAGTVMDRCDLTLPEAGSRSFWLRGSAWQFPDFENVDTFVDRLVREELLAWDPVVTTALQGRPVELSARSVQRRFVQTTGLTHSLIYQIERARQAVQLLRQGVSILDTIEQAGYFDQPHLTRSLKRFTGLTPAQASRPEGAARLSFLYKTPSFC